MTDMYSGVLCQAYTLLKGSTYHSQTYSNAKKYREKCIRYLQESKIQPGHFEVAYFPFFLVLLMYPF